MSGEVRDRLGDARVVLLCVPSMSERADRLEMDLLARAPPSETDLLFVTYSRPVETFLGTYREVVGAEPATVGVVGVGDSRATATAPEVETVARVSKPGDVTGLGIAISEFLEGRDRVAVAFDSLTAMLQYVDLERTYEFLHAVTGRLYAADALAHVRIDPTAHDDRTVDTLLSLFDGVVRVPVDGEPAVRTRFSPARG